MAMKRKGAQLAVPADAPSLTVQLPHNADDAARLQKKAEADLAEILQIAAVTSAEEFTAADEILTDVVRQKDALMVMRDGAVIPLRRAAETIRGWFAPGIAAREQAEKHLKAVMGKWQLARDTAEREARDAAHEAAKVGDSEALIESLTAATEAAAKPAARATTRFVWVVDRIIKDLLLPDYLIPDEKRIAAEARAHVGDEPPVVPGVLFKREAQIGARR